MNRPLCRAGSRGSSTALETAAQPSPLPRSSGCAIDAMTPNPKRNGGPCRLRRGPPDGIPMSRSSPMQAQSLPPAGCVAAAGGGAGAATVAAAGTTAGATGLASAARSARSAAAAARSAAAAARSAAAKALVAISAALGAGGATGSAGLAAATGWLAALSGAAAFTRDGRSGNAPVSTAAGFCRVSFLPAAAAADEVAASLFDSAVSDGISRPRRGAGVALASAGASRDRNGRDERAGCHSPPAEAGLAGRRAAGGSGVPKMSL